MTSPCADNSLIEGFLIPSKFELVLPKMVVSLANNVQAVSLPEFSIGTAMYQPAGTAPIKIPGDAPEYSTLAVRFLVDQNLVVYELFMKWLKACSYPEDPTQFSNFVGQYIQTEFQNSADVLTQDMVLISKSGTSRDMVWTFKDTFPISISGFEFDVAITDATITTVDVAFNYTSFSIHRAGVSSDS